MVERSLATTRAGLAETRRTLQAPRASPIEDLGLVLALRSLAENAAARTDIALSGSERPPGPVRRQASGAPGRGSLSALGLLGALPRSLISSLHR